jgi:type IV secretory pathway TraG/TraD family ATPase VirD4
LFQTLKQGKVDNYANRVRTGQFRKTDIDRQLDELATAGVSPGHIYQEKITGTKRNPAQDAKEIAAAIIPVPANVNDPFWAQAAQNLLTGFILHYHHAGYSFVDTVTETLTRKVGSARPRK